MKNLNLLFFLLTTLSTWAQDESIGPIRGTASMQQESFRSGSTFDSTFIYTADTLSLPFFDDFSSNHFQVYANNFSDPTITTDKRYKLLDLSSTPLPAQSTFTTQQTFRRTVDMNELTFEDTPLPSENILVADLSSYDASLNPTTTKVYPPYFIYDTIGFVNDPDTIYLSDFDFKQDSATQFFGQLNDKNAFWLDYKAKHNYTNAINPWSLGVVTFDGLDENGVPYIFGSTTVDYNDVLTSKPINMTGLTAADSVYFSFLFQSQGFNDIPENGDSLLLEFYASVQKQWIQVWSSSTRSLTNFDRVHFPVVDNKFFKADFQFRFRNYSSNAGALDQFHIDFVQLRSSSGFQDSLFKDFAIVYPITSLLKDYTQVPWDHYKNTSTNKMADKFRVTLRSGSNKPENNEDGQVTIRYQGTPEGNFILNKDILSGGVNYDIPQQVYESFHNLTGGYEFDRAKTGDYQEFDVKMTAKAQFFHYAPNDTTYHKQRFYDAYAYDDGSAEAAYGPTGVQSQLAYQFTPFEADSLVGVRMRFVQSVNDASKQLFLLSVWDDNNGKPGQKLYEDGFLSPREPSYTYDDSMGFTNYYFSDFKKIGTNGTFCVGWRQLEAQRLNIGMDMNQDQSSKIFFSVDNGQVWKNSSFKGALLMRPIYSTALNHDLSVTPIKEKSSLSLYPNPTSNTLTIKTDEPSYQGVELYDLHGQILLSVDANEKLLDLSIYQAGIYLLRDKANGFTYKVIKK